MRDGSQRSVNTQFSPRFGLGSRQVEGCFSLRLVSNGHPRPFVFSLSSFPKKHFEIKGSFAHLFPTARQSTRDRAQRLMGAEASAEGFLHSPSSWRYCSTPPGPRHGVANQLSSLVHVHFESRARAGVLFGGRRMSALTSLGASLHHLHPFRN